MYKPIVLALFLLGFIQLYSQDKKNFNLFKPHKLGLLYNYGSEDNFLFDDPDYTYSSHIVKTQFFYNIARLKASNIQLIIQPQYQWISHQLINEQFVTPDDEDYIIKRKEFTAKKNINLYGLEFGIALLKPINKTCHFRASISLGLNYINTRTERLAKGFTFLENFSLGMTKQLWKKSEFYIGTNFGHVSNLNIQTPNDGYNVLGIEVGYSIFLQ